MTRHCEHVKANGHFCGSPAMRGRNYCFFHITYIGQRLRLERYNSLGLQAPAIELPLLEDAASVQVALMQVTQALLQGTLDRRTAGLVLYSLQTASSNLRNMQKEAEADAKANVAICNRYDSFEQDYELDDATASSLLVEDPADKAEAEAAEKARAALQNERKAENESNAENQSQAENQSNAGDGKAAVPPYSVTRSLIAKGEAMGFLRTKGVCMPGAAGAEYGPQHLTDREPENGGCASP